MKTSRGLIVFLNLSAISGTLCAAPIALALKDGENFVKAAAIDDRCDTAYFALSDTDFPYSLEGSSATVARIRLADFQRVRSLRLRAGDNPVDTIVIGPGGREAFLGIYGDPNRDIGGAMVKMDLQHDRWTGRVDLGHGAYGVSSAIFDAQGAKIYFGTLFGTVAGVDVSSMSVFGSAELARENNAFLCAAIDPAGDYGYFATATGNVLKMNLRHFTPVGSLAAQDRQKGFTADALDLNGRSLFLATGASPAKVIELSLSLFTIRDRLLLEPGQGRIVAAAVDAPSGDVLLVTGDNPIRVIRLAAHPLRTVGEAALPRELGAASCAIYDRRRRVIYVGAQRLGEPAQIVKVPIPPAHENLLAP